jgi:hypothetical protein
VSFSVNLKKIGLTLVCIIYYIDTLRGSDEERTGIFALLRFIGPARWKLRRGGGDDVPAHSGRRRR